MSKGERSRVEEQGVDPVENGGSAKAVSDAGPTVGSGRASVLAPGILGTLVAGCALAAAAAGGYAALTLTGGLQDLAWPRQVPWPVLAAAGGAVLLALVASIAAARVAARARGSIREVELVLSIVSSLPPEDPGTWQPARFRERPALAEFLQAVGGDLQRMRSRLARHLGLEGELTRLEQSLAGGQGPGRPDAYESPAIGRVVDLVAGLQERTEKAESELAELREHRQKVDLLGGEACPQLEDSLRWNTATLDRLGVQEVELKRLAGEAHELGRRIAAGRAVPATDPAGELGAVHKELIALAEQDQDVELSRAVRRIGRAAERGGRLAIRAAAEVSRLGAAGEPMLQVIQEVQDLVTDVRAAGTLLEECSAPAASPRLEALGRRLEQVAATIRNQDRVGQATARLAEGAEAIAAGVRQAAGVLDALPAGFNEQAERLTRAGRLLADASGCEFDPQSHPAPRSGAGMDVERFSDFGAAPLTTPRGKKPVASDSIFEPSEPVDLDGGQEPSDRREPSAPAPEEDRVHDLSEFDAVPLDGPPSGEDRPTDGEAPVAAAPVGAEEPERIYDLSEFDAEPLD